MLFYAALGTANAYAEIEGKEEAIMKNYKYDASHI